MSDILDEIIAENQKRRAAEAARDAEAIRRASMTEDEARDEDRANAEERARLKRLGVKFTDPADTDEETPDE